MEAVFAVDQIRRAEQPLLRAQGEPDELMRHAAKAVADAAKVMLAAPRPYFLGRHATRVLLLVGSGGNGGDALYAGSLLAAEGVGVDAVLLGGAPHERALATFRRRGGAVLVDGLPDFPPGLRGGGAPEPLDPARPESARPWGYCLVIDGIAGLGGSGPLREKAARIVRVAAKNHARFLAVDVPSGIAADTGVVEPGASIADPEWEPGDPDEPSPRTLDLPGHVTADVTVTFGGLRFAHALSDQCGEVVVADIALDGDGPELHLRPRETWPAGAQAGRSLHGQLHADLARDAADGTTPTWTYYRSLAVPPRNAFTWPTLYDGDPGDVWTSVGDHPRPPRPGFPRDLEPGAGDDKYSGGVVGICAGGGRYPGAGVLAATAAVRATPSMVRYVGSGSAEVVRALPEVVAHPSLDDAGRVDAWVVGSGRGTDDAAAAELSELLGRGDPLLVDADAITMLARRPELREKLVAREGETVLTPHAGEFRRLADAMAEAGEVGEEGSESIPDPAEHPIEAAKALAVALDCAVLLKGRRTVVAMPAEPGHRAGTVRIIDAGTSWAATPGSGDVLSGLIGAWLAKDGMAGIAPAVTVHARAAEIAARTPAGYAPTSASLIAEAIREATAALAAETAWPTVAE
ncbi:bifunctional ADP-dependent NAD(P)H-hydrate dehydratase/NAD(P)H-hydrate epimerase [Corynebacterium xerosis]|uniref:ADP-dependent (S)-NAD(P)H-hydrate dehydratase n=1 Tax=Corynebacterium xerosis TaxID=1725 RepID=A0A7X9SX13_9CORY|nr:bifunctional ADP-dependent NAD(P)H-hydrate dehydratase/NAD(P)H-hydrate epimerase [Corynebacterium xerosis]NMF09591.1 bifunctional ADP-dependent NAD(P)H-hydrate dehydratase/NAD(P)H-hydrate epimerase [Corynebacterium xerosis]